MPLMKTSFWRFGGSGSGWEAVVRITCGLWLVSTLTAGACWVATNRDCPPRITVEGTTCSLVDPGDTYPWVQPGRSRSWGWSEYRGDDDRHCLYDCAGMFRKFYSGAHPAGTPMVCP